MMSNVMPAQGKKEEMTVRKKYYGQIQGRETEIQLPHTYHSIFDNRLAPLCFNLITYNSRHREFIYSWIVELSSR